MITALLAKLVEIDEWFASLRRAWRRWHLERLFWAFYNTTPLEREEFIQREDAADLAAPTLKRDRQGELVTMREAWDRGSALYRVMREVPPPDRKGTGRWAGL